jgi:hypothetical protein
VSQVADIALIRDLAARNPLQGLGGPKLKIGLCHFGFERHQQIVARFDRPRAFGIRRLHGAAHLAEQVELPRRIEPELVNVHRLLERPDQLLRACRGRRTGPEPLRFHDARQAQLLPGELCRPAQARQTLGARRLHLNSRLDDAQESGLEIQIPGRRPLLEGIEFGVVKLLPPKNRGRRFDRTRSGGRFVHGTRVALGDGFLRRDEIGADALACGQAGGAQHQGGARVHQWAPARPDAFTGENRNVKGTNAKATRAQ